METSNLDSLDEMSGCFCANSVSEEEGNEAGRLLTQQSPNKECGSDRKLGGCFIKLTSSVTVETYAWFH